MQRLSFFRSLKGRIALLAVLPTLAVGVLATAAGVFSLWQLRETRMHVAMDAAAARAHNELTDGQNRMGTYAVALSHTNPP